MIAHMSYVMCDRCGNPAEEGDDAREARRYARREGYVRKLLGGSRRDLCRSCWEEVQSGESLDRPRNAPLLQGVRDA